MATINNGEEDDDDVEARSRIDDLNDALLELIFTKLSPWRYLAVSKCVSKRWESIISNPDFTRQLTSQSLPFTLVVVADGHYRQCIITENSHFPKHKFPLEFIPTPHNFVATTNELVVAYHNINSQIGEYYVANPLTKQYVVVPIPDKPVSTRPWAYMLGIAGFVNGVSTVNVLHRDNYYYNNNNLGFRIVQVTAENYKSNSTTVQIYSSETGQWKTYLFDRWECPRSIWRSAITWNNKIHWTNNGSKFVVIDPFDLDNIAPRVLRLPISVGPNSVLGVCQNRLRITQFEETCSNRQNQRIKIWEIEDYNNRVEYYSGTDCFLVEVKLVIDFVLKRSLLNSIFPAIDKYDPSKYHQIICCHPNDPQVVYFYYGGRIFYCNVVEHKYKKVGYCQMTWEAFVFVHPP